MFEFDVSGLRLAALQKQFSVEGVSFRMQGQVVLIEVENALGKATISPFGATVLQFQPVGEEPILWQSPAAVFDGKKAIRGGIPICWPWFGNAASDDLPAHGFVRNRDWQIQSIQTLPAGTELIFAVESDRQTLEVWPYEFRLELKVMVGKTLNLTLITHNLSDRPVEITEALHSYFAVSDVNAVQVSGLGGAKQLDTLVPSPVAKTAEDLLSVQAPIDSVFVDQSQALTLIDETNHRKLIIEKQNSHSAIVWNAGPEIVKGFGDIPDDAWPGYLCVESGNVWGNALVIPANKTHVLSLSIHQQTLQR